MLQKQIRDLKDGKKKRTAEIEAIIAQIAELLKNAGKNKAAEDEARRQMEELTRAAEERRLELEALSTEGDANLEKLREIREQLAKWHAEKDQAASLHAQAQALLNRTGQKPLSP